MNFLPAPSAQTWWTLFEGLGCDACALGLLALLFEWRFKAPRARRAIWQAAFVSLACCLLIEVTGLSHGLSAWLFPPQTRSSWQLNADFRARVLRSLPESLPAPMAVEATPPRDLTPDSPGPSRRPFQLAWLPGLLWLAGIAVVLLPAAGGRLLLALLCRRGSLAGAGGLTERWPSLAAAAGRRNVLLLILPSLKSPIAFGFFRPVVGLPKDFFEGFTWEEQEAILAHELAHLTAGDPAWKLFSDLVRAAFWWHPVVWWGKHRFSAASEMAADETSADVTHRPAALAECLVRLGGRALASDRGGLSVRGSGFRSGLGRRVARLLDLEQRSEGLMTARACAPLRLIVTGFLIITLLTSAGTSQALDRRALPGDQTMQNQHNHHWWNKSLAHFILLAALAPAAPTAPVAATEAPTPAPPPATENTPPAIDKPAQPADPNQQTPPGLSEALRRRYGLGPGLSSPGAQPTPPLDMAEAMRRRYGIGPRMSAAPPPGAGEPAAPTVPPDAPPVFPFGWSEEMYKRYGFPVPRWVAGAGKTPAPPPGIEEPAAPTAPPEEGQPSQPPGWSPEMYRRYGLPIPPGMAGGGPGRTALTAKLESIQFDEIYFDGLPLSEVIKFLIDETTRRDAGKQGVNFIVSNRDGRLAGAAIDPTTGQPVPSPDIDLNNVQIRINHPLRHVRLVDVLDAITKVSDRPLKYTIEPYGVIFSHGAPAMEPGAVPADVLMVRTFQVDPATILGNLLRVFPPGALTGRLPMPGGSPGDSVQAQADLQRSKIQPLLREMLVQLGVAMNPPKTIFYNGANGLVLVRASASDFDLIEAAFKMLSEPGQGQKPSTGGGGGSGGGGISPESQKPRASSPGKLLFTGAVKSNVLQLVPGEKWTIYEALAQVGMTDFANQKKIIVNRIDPTTQKIEVITVDMDLVRKDRTKDLLLQDGDRIEVKEKGAIY